MRSKLARKRWMSLMIQPDMRKGLVMAQTRLLNTTSSPTVSAPRMMRMPPTEIISTISKPEKNSMRGI